RDNLRALFGSLYEFRNARIWLPLLGIEGGGLSRGQSLDLLLDVIRDSPLAGRDGDRFVIATSPDIEISELVDLRGRVEGFFGREPADTRQALSQLGISAAEETVSLLETAAYLMLGQRPGF